MSPRSLIIRAISLAVLQGDPIDVESQQKFLSDASFRVIFLIENVDKEQTFTYKHDELLLGFFTWIRQTKMRLAITYSSVCSLLFVLLSHVCVAQEPDAIQSLSSYLEKNENVVASVADQPFASLPLTKSECQKAQGMLVNAWRASVAKERKAELKGTELKIDDHKMKFFQRKFGDKPESGWSLYISMHGGGGAPTRVNDRQWENQKRLYSLKEGIYVVPRAPTDTWDLWHQEHIDKFYDRLITNFIVSEGVNPDRVYILGYSAGGDGVYQLAPRMADRFAAAAMMAGHPNDAAAESLRNLPFTIHMGELDGSYNRNKKAANWKKKLADFREKDPNGYTHHVEIHKGKGHWMDRDDAVAVDWMAKYSRQRFPERVVWKQDNVKQLRFYWLAVEEVPEKRPLIVASREGQTVSIDESDVGAVSILVNDDMLNMDQKISIQWQGKMVQSRKVNRTIGQLVASLLERGDPAMMFSARIEVAKPE